MTVTQRDRVWRAAIVESGESHWRGFRVDDVLARIEEENQPSRKTVQRVLRAMSELGVLEHRTGSPHYNEGPVLKGDDGNDIAASGLSPPEPAQDAQDDEEGEDPTVHLSTDVVAVQDERGAAESDESGPLSGVTFPAGRDRGECVEAVQAARAYLQRHGRRTMREFVQDVMPEHPLGYDVPELEQGERFRGAWWRKVVKPGLEAYPDVQPPTGGAREWRFEG